MPRRQVAFHGGPAVKTNIAFFAFVMLFQMPFEGQVVWKNLLAFFALVFFSMVSSNVVMVAVFVSERQPTMRAL